MMKLILNWAIKGVLPNFYKFGKLNNNDIF